jgi:hypothetical protein
MAKKRKQRIRPRDCPLTTSKRKRAAADQMTASIKEHFPAGLAQPALRALAGAGYSRLDDLRKVKEADLLQLHGMGPQALEILRSALKNARMASK